MPRALEQIRRMRGGAQAHLIRADDGHFYVVKFQNNPQAAAGGRILVNEFVGTRLAARLGLLTPPAVVIDVSRELIELSEELVMQIGTATVPCRPGPQFGSRYPGNPAEVCVYDFLPEPRLTEVENVEDFLGIFVVDKLVCNTNGRQAIFFQEPGRSGYQASFVDFGFAFNAGEWSFPDAPLRGIYPRHRVYAGVTGMKSFEPWLDRVERMTPNVLDEIAKEIPLQWYDRDQGALFHLLEQVYARRKKLPDLILEAKNSYRQPFVNWG